MTIPFNRDGISLPVCQSLLNMLSQEAERTDLDLGRCTGNPPEKLRCS